MIEEIRSSINDQLGNIKEAIGSMIDEKPKDHWGVQDPPNGFLAGPVGFLSSPWVPCIPVGLGIRMVFFCPGFIVPWFPVDTSGCSVA